MLLALLLAGGDAGVLSSVQAQAEPPGESPPADAAPSPPDLGRPVVLDSLLSQPAALAAADPDPPQLALTSRRPPHRTFLFPELASKDGERPVSFTATSSILGNVQLDIPAGAELQLGGDLGVRIGNLEYTGFDLSDKSGDNTLTLHLSSGQRSTWESLRAISEDPLQVWVGLPALETFAGALRGLGQDLEGLPPEQASALMGERLRASVELLASGDPSLAPALSGIDPALLAPLGQTLESIIEHFYYERPGELGLRNLVLRGEASGNTTSQYRQTNAAGDLSYAEISRGAGYSIEDMLALRVTYGSGGSAASAPATLHYAQRSSSVSSSFNSFTVGHNRWALAVSEIRSERELALSQTRAWAASDDSLGLSDEHSESHDFSSRQVESRIWALRSARARGWDLEIGAGAGFGRSEETESASFVRHTRALAAGAAPAGTDFSVDDGLESETMLPPPPGIAADLDSAEYDVFSSRTRSRMGGGLLVGARRVSTYSELGVRAIYFGSLRQQATLSIGGAAPVGRLGLVGDLQADLLREPSLLWDEEHETYLDGSASSSALTPTAAIVCSLEEGALTGLHSWQGPFELQARRRDPRRLGRALFAGASGRRGDELFAGLSFGRGSYVSAAVRQGEGSYRHLTLSGRRRNLHLELGLGSGSEAGETERDARRQVGLSYLQFVYNRDGERFVSLTLNPEKRGVDVSLVADASALAAWAGRGWARLRRWLGP